MQNEINETSPMDWRVGSSIAIELDLVLSMAGQGYNRLGLPPDLAEILEGLPQDWLAELPLYYGAARQFVNMMEFNAYLAGMLECEEYDQVTLAVRELTQAAALERLAAAAGQLELFPDQSLDLPERLAELGARLTVETFRSCGLRRSDEAVWLHGLQTDFLRAGSVLRDGERHTRFWHWLDRFYYEFYRPWRVARLPLMEDRRRQATLALTGAAGLDWLPAQSPLLRYAELEQAVRSGRLPLFLWVEPFGLSDYWSLYPHLLVLSFAEPGRLYEDFQAAAAGLAGRAQALADPTRLIILRIIRNFSMVNTEIASYLGLARPTVSVHAKILREAGLIRSYADGRLVRHEIVPAEVRRLFRDLDRFLDLPEEE